MGEEAHRRSNKHYDRRDRQRGRNRGGELEVDWEERLQDSRRGREDRVNRHGRRRR